MQTTQGQPPTDWKPAPRRFTRAEYDELVERGFFQNERVQLIDGEIIPMSPQGPRHSTSTYKVRRALERAFGLGVVVREQAPLALSEESEPEPDVAVVPGEVDDFRDRHPRSALLVVEVADSSLALDRRAKTGLYASGGIAEYWILNLVDDVLEVYRSPRELQPGTYGYADFTRHGRGDAVAPVAAPGSSIAVADLLP